MNYLSAIFRWRLVGLLLVYKYLRQCESDPCDATLIPEDVVDDLTASDLADIVICEDGSFTINWIGAVQISKTIVIGDRTSLTIVGSDDASVDGTNTYQLFDIGDGGSLSLALITLEGGNATYGGAVNLGVGSIFSSDTCVFDSNTADYGGAISISSGAVAAISSSIFTKNTAQFAGGAIYSLGEGNIVLMDTDFEFCTSQVDGGAIYLNVLTELSITQTDFVNCTASSYGGAISAAAQSVIIADTCSFSSNVANSGGGIYCSGSVNCSVCNGVNNTATTAGGFLFMGLGSTAVISDSEFSLNNAFNGGGVFSQSDTILSISDTNFVDNKAQQSGASIFIYDKVFEIETLNVNYADSASNCCFAMGTATLIADLLFPDYTCSDIDAGVGTWDCCSATQYIEDNLCNDCGEGFDCNELGIITATLPVSAGFWRESLDSTNVLTCLNKEACAGGGNVEDPDGYCAAGYSGPYCAVCAEGYAQTLGYSCSSCSGGSAAIALFIVIIVLILAAFVILLVLSALLDVGNIADAGDVLESQSIFACVKQTISYIPFDKLRIPYVVLTIITQFLAITGLELPPVYANFLRWVDVVNFDLRWLSAASCSVKIGFYGKLIITTLVPLGFLALVGCSYLFFLARNRLDRVNPQELHLRIRAQKKSLAKHLLVVLVFCFLIYSTVSTVVFQAFACDTLPYSGNSFLRADYSVSCYDTAHDAFRVYAALMIVLYPVGIPCLFYWLLWRRCDRILELQRMLELPNNVPNKGDVHEVTISCSESKFDVNLVSTAFLWSKYRKHRWWWEVAECMRRLLFTGFLVFIFPGTQGQVAVSCLFAVSSMMLFGMVQPIRDKLDERSYWLGCFILFGTCFSALLLKVNYTEGDFVIAVMLVVLNIMLIAAAISQIVTGYMQIRRESIVDGNSLYGLRRKKKIDEVMGIFEMPVNSESYKHQITSEIFSPDIDAVRRTNSSRITDRNLEQDFI